jgi:trigger factor
MIQASFTALDALNSIADINISWDVVAPHFQSKLSAIQQQAQVPGFRPGKSPLALIKKRFHDVIGKEVIDSLLDSALGQAASEHKVPVTLVTKIRSHELKEGKGLTVSLEVETMPNYELGNWRGIQVKVLDATITPEQVEEVIAAELARDCEVKSNEKVIEASDHMVSCRVTILDDEASELLVDDVEHDFHFPGKEGEQGIIAAMIGKKPLQTFSLRLEPGDISLCGERSCRRTVHLEVLSVTNLEQRTLDDAWAQSKGAASLQDLRESLALKMKQRREKEEEDRKTEQLTRKLVHAHEFPLPEMTVMNRVMEHAREAAKSYASLFRHPQHGDKFAEHFIRREYGVVAFGLRRDSILDKIADELSFEPSSEHLLALLEDLETNEENEAYVAQVRQQIQMGVREPGIVRLARRKYAMDELAKSAVVSVVASKDELEAELEREAGESEGAQADAAGHCHDESCSHHHGAPATEQEEAASADATSTPAPAKKARARKAEKPSQPEEQVAPAEADIKAKVRRKAKTEPAS